MLLQTRKISPPSSPLPSLVELLDPHTTQHHPNQPMEKHHSSLLLPRLCPPWTLVPSVYKPKATPSSPLCPHLPPTSLTHTRAPSPPPQLCLAWVKERKKLSAFPTKSSIALSLVLLWPCMSLYSTPLLLLLYLILFFWPRTTSTVASVKLRRAPSRAP